MTVVGESVAQRPLPVNVVGVAQQIEFVTTAELQQQVELIRRNTHQKAVPRLINLGIRHRNACHFSDFIAKLRIANQSLLVEQEEALLMAHVEHRLYVCNAQFIETVDATLAVEIYQYPAKVYNKRIYSLQIHYSQINCSLFLPQTLNPTYPFAYP